VEGNRLLGWTRKGTIQLEEVVWKTGPTNRRGAEAFKTMDRQRCLSEKADRGKSVFSDCTKQARGRIEGNEVCPRGGLGGKGEKEFSLRGGGLHSEEKLWLGVEGRGRKEGVDYSGVERKRGGKCVSYLLRGRPARVDQEGGGGDMVDSRRKKGEKRE